MITQLEIEAFARFLKKCGYPDDFGDSDGAQKVILNELLPIAMAHQCTLVEAAELYANPAEEQDTSWYAVYEAIRNARTQFPLQLAIFNK